MHSSRELTTRECSQRCWQLVSNSTATQILWKSKQEEISTFLAELLGCCGTSLLSAQLQIKMKWLTVDYYNLTNRPYEQRNVEERWGCGIFSSLLG